LQSSSIGDQKEEIVVGWDGESATWWTDGEDIPGLCCQASTFESLVETVLALAPELLVANGLLPAGAGDVPITVGASF
jgi:hypothetical protein